MKKVESILSHKNLFGLFLFGYKVNTYINHLRTNVEIAFGRNPMLPPTPKVKKAQKIKKVLFVARKYDYFGDKELCYPYKNFSGALEELKEVVHFDPVDLYRKHGRKKMNQMLLDKVKHEDPDLIFFIVDIYLIFDMIGLSRFEPEVLKELSEDTRSITFNWFTDDETTFDSFARYWAPKFNFCSTTQRKSYERHLKLGYSNIILSQWGVNQNIYPKTNVKKDIDVSFVGQCFSDRGPIIKSLKEKGISVECFGDRWDNGRLSHKDMVRIFNQSKISLGLSTSIRGDLNHIKARTFEIPACGTFLLTQDAPELENFYEDGKEIVVFKNTEELAEKIRFYLSHEKERETIAKAGYTRTVREHTYKHRFVQIFKTIEEAAS